VQFKAKRYLDMLKYSEWDSDYVPIEKKPVPPSENLHKWQLDALGRDQYMCRHGDDTEVSWCDGLRKPVLVSSGPSGVACWCKNMVQWSVNGTYLVTIHEQGIGLWGGPNFKRICSFNHKYVQFVDFSPCEKYVVTWDGRVDDEPRLIIWDVKTGAQMRTFKVLPKHAEWPIMKWSFDGSYVAQSVDHGVKVFQTPSFKMLDKKIIRCPDIRQFSWSPGGANVFIYWAQGLLKKR